MARLDIQMMAVIALMFLLIFEVIRGLDCEDRGGSMQREGFWYSCGGVAAGSASRP